MNSGINDLLRAHARVRAWKRRGALNSRALRRFYFGDNCTPTVLSYQKRQKKVTILAGKKKDGFDAKSAERMSSREIAAFLDERERKFAAEFNADMNGTQAAIRAGYKPGKNNGAAAVTASRLLRDPRIRAYRVALIRESVEDQTLTKESLVLKLLEIYRRCMQAEPVLTYDSDTREWVESGIWKFDAKGAERAIEQLSRMLGHDAPVKLAADEDAGGVIVLAEVQGNE